tara:strand:+ start:586 stop:975 length:390 start_codon:yes stop_codon:yes gene_type:complete
MYTTIQNPKNGKIVKINSKLGKQIISNYIKNIMYGGDNWRINRYHDDGYEYLSDSWATYWKDTLGLPFQLPNYNGDGWHDYYLLLHNDTHKRNNTYHSSNHIHIWTEADGSLGVKFKGAVPQWMKDYFQ